METIGAWFSKIVNAPTFPGSLTDVASPWNRLFSGERIDLLLALDCYKVGEQKLDKDEFVYYDINKMILEKLFSSHWIELYEFVIKEIMPNLVEFIQQDSFIKTRNDFLKVK